MERRGFLGALAALAGLGCAATTQETVARGVARTGGAELAAEALDPDLFVVNGGGASFSDINSVLKRAYPPDFFAEAVEREAVFRRRLSGGR